MDDRPDDRDDLDPSADGTRRSTLAATIGVATVVLMAVLAAVVLATDDEDELVTEGSTTTEATTTMVPTEPEPIDPAPEGTPGGDSALVGLTELQVRELYPLVRVVEVDGEALPTTMDLLPGRINISVADGEVVAATTEGCEELTDESPTWMQQACDPDPDADGPDSFGKLIGGDGDALALEVGFNADEYYQGMAVVPDDMTMLRDTTGAPLAADELVTGDVVWIWTSGACGESSPVQCDMAAIVVDRPAAG
jgi:hypothetical protein